MRVLHTTLFFHASRALGPHPPSAISFAMTCLHPIQRVPAAQANCAQRLVHNYHAAIPSPHTMLLRISIYG